MTRSARRVAVVAVVAAAAVALGSASALAHVEVEATPARALATDALLTMTAEAESRTAGITGVRIQLPSGLVPADLRLESGPAGWRLSGSGDVVTVAGPALPVGRSLRLGIRVRQLPAAPQLVLKTVQSYSDGRQDSWIELASASVSDPEQPAPVVRLRPAAPGATTVPRTMAAPAGTPRGSGVAPAAPATGTPRTSGAAPATSAADDDSGSGAGWLFGGVLVGIALLGGIVVAARRRLR